MFCNLGKIRHRVRTNKFLSNHSKWATPMPKQGIILRDFFSEQLFQNIDSYFANKAPVHVSHPIAFNKLWGHGSYLRALSKEYKGGKGFLTPVEIFKPYFAESLARHIVSWLSVHNIGISDSNPLHLCEIGGGNGNCLLGILDFLEKNQPNIYKNTLCTMIDVSSTFLEIQKNTLGRHLQKISFFRQSILDWDHLNTKTGFVIGLELLDNLPHDKLVMKSNGIPHETRIFQDPNGGYIEKHFPISDPLIIEYLNLFCDYYNIPKSCFDNSSNSEYKNVLWDCLNKPTLKSTPTHERIYRFYFNLKSKLQFGATPLHYNICYIPTGSYLFLKKISQSFPNHGLILSDFNELKGTLPGTNAPLVQNTQGEVILEKDTYLDVQGNYDIFFPTNFRAFSLVFESLWKERKYWVWSSKEFMKKNAELRKTRTRLGFNPLVADYVNTEFFLSEPKEAK